jgi:sulfate adenylyltransferase subunit 1 (EFTu-like GTPase family)
MSYIPLSALTGDNVVETDAMPWARTDDPRTP